MLQIENSKYLQKDFIEPWLPRELLTLPQELAKVDKILEDESFIEPFLKRFNTKMGRPTTPLKCYIRMMFVKFYYNLSYERLVEEISDSIMLRKFCRFSLADKIPHSTTLIKLSHKYKSIIDELNLVLIRKCTEQRANKFKRARIDSTVIEANIKYPTDAHILAATVNSITRIIKKAKDKGMRCREKFPDISRKIKRCLYKIAKLARKRSCAVKEQIKTHTEELLNMTKATYKKATKVKEKLEGNFKEKLGQVLDLSRCVIEQTNEVLAGKKVKDKILSIYDPDASVIKRGKAHKEVEFGYKVCMVGDESGMVVAHNVYNQAAADVYLLDENLEEAAWVVGKYPDEVAADKGFYSQDGINRLKKYCKRVCIPKRGKLRDSERALTKKYWYRRLWRFRVGFEAAISILKRKFGLSRVYVKGLKNVVMWVGYTMFVYNLWRAPI